MRVLQGWIEVPTMRVLLTCYEGWTDLLWGYTINYEGTSDLLQRPCYKALTCDESYAEVGYKEHFQDEITIVIHKSASDDGDNSQSQVLDSLHTNNKVNLIKSVGGESPFLEIL